MKKLKRRALGALVVLVLLAVGVGYTVPAGCKPHEETEAIGLNPSNPSPADTAKEPPASPKVEETVESKYKPGETFCVNFRMRQYEEKTVESEGKAIFCVNYWEMFDRAGHEIPKNGKFLAVNIKVGGDTGNKGFPADFAQTGIDPAPRLFIVDAGGARYKENSWAGTKLNDRPPRSLTDIGISETTPQSLNLAFDVPAALRNPRLWIESVNMKGEKEIAEVPLGAPNRGREIEQVELGQEIALDLPVFALPNLSKSAVPLARGKINVCWIPNSTSRSEAFQTEQGEYRSEKGILILLGVRIIHDSENTSVYDTLAAANPTICLPTFYDPPESWGKYGSPRIFLIDKAGNQYPLKQISGRTLPRMTEPGTFDRTLVFDVPKDISHPELVLDWISPQEEVRTVHVTLEKQE